MTPVDPANRTHQATAGLVTPKSQLASPGYETTNSIPRPQCADDEHVSPYDDGKSLTPGPQSSDLKLIRHYSNPGHELRTTPEDRNVVSPGRSLQNAIEIVDTPKHGKRKSFPKATMSPFLETTSTKRRRRMTLPAVHASDVNNGVEEPVLTDQQQSIVAKIKEGKSLFFTGSAGTGKSVLLRAAVRALRQRYSANPAYVAVTAPTGIAAINIGGCTLHSFAGVGLGKESVEALVVRIIHSKKALDRWISTQVLVIDEISMLDGTFFDKLELIARYVRGKWDDVEDVHSLGDITISQEPFGGIQLVISGDFFQLPPVPEKDGRKSLPITYAFDASTWKTCVPNCYMLRHVFRQKDSSFVNMLNKLRIGELEPKAIQQFERLSRKVRYEDEIEPTQLFSLRAQVENANNFRLSTLPGPTYVYLADDTPGYDRVNNRKFTQEESKRALERVIALKEVSLKKGAQVMLIQNMNSGQLVNGSVGIVTGFVRPHKPPGGDAVEPTRSDDVQVVIQDVAKACECLGECDCGETSSQHVLDGRKWWPEIEFVAGDKVTLAPVDFAVHSLDGSVEARRFQVPIILAWALSIHKSQGQTLERVKVDLGTVFEKGQAYVAMSRATSLQTLQILNFDPKKVMAHPRVIEWSKDLEQHIDDVE